MRCPVIAAQHAKVKLEERKLKAEVEKLTKMPVRKDAAEAAKVAEHLTAVETAARLATAMVAANKAAAPKTVPPPTLAELTAVCQESWSKCHRKYEREMSISVLLVGFVSQSPVVMHIFLGSLHHSTCVCDTVFTHSFVCTFLLVLRAQTRDEIFPRIAELEAAELQLMAKKVDIAKELIAAPPSSELQAQVKKLSALLTKNNEDSDQLKKRRKRVEPTVREREAELQPVIASAYRAQVRVKMNGELLSGVFVSFAMSFLQHSLKPNQ